jgi:hypothetical protein
MAKLAEERGIPSIMSFFNQSAAEQARREKGQATIVTATNVFAHIEHIDDIVKSILTLLKDGGIFISESHYLPSLVETLQYDTIYHEHLRYYSLSSLGYLLNRHGLEIIHAKRIPTHGGSIRVYSARKGAQPIRSSVKDLLHEEDSTGLTDGSSLKSFSKRVVQSKMDLYALLAPLKRSGARIYGIGAPSRASTLINYIGLDDGILDAVMEINTSHKLNKYMPGTRIPVLDEALLFQNQPEYALLLSWHITNELVANLKKNGYRGKFITPLPEPRVIG